MQQHRTDLLGLNALRGFAALSVLLFHCIYSAGWSNFPEHGPLVWFRIGGFGVSIFFALSGFVVVQAAMREMAADPARARAIFMGKRIARIMPLYLLTSIAFLIFVDSATLRGEQAWFQVLTHLTFTHSLFASTIQSINGPTWSIGIEFQLYLLVALAMPWLARCRLLIVALICVALPIAYRATAYLIQRDLLNLPFDSQLYWVASIQVPGTIDAFGVGAVLAIFESRQPSRAFWRSWWLPILAMATVLALLSSFLLRQAPYIWGSFIWASIWLSLAATMSVALLAIAMRLPNAGATLFHRPMIYLGTISYGVYLWHVPVIHVLKATTPFTQGKLAAAVVVVTMCLASLSWHWFEKPLIEWARRFLNRGRSTETGAPG